MCNFGQTPGEHKMVILGDMRELGKDALQEHQRIISLLEKQKDLESVWLVGEVFMKTASSFRCFEDVEAVKATLKSEPIKNRLVLIKGSNGMRLYQLPELL